MTHLNPFRPGGRRISDAQTPPKPADRVLLIDPELFAFLGASAVWVPEDGHNVSGRLDYNRPAGASEPRYLDVERAMVLMARRVAAVEQQAGLGTVLLRAMAHGAILDGLGLSTDRGSRTLHLSGGSVLLFHNTSSGVVLRRHPILTADPLQFFVVAGSHAVARRDAVGDDGLASEVPYLCANPGESGELVPQPADTYRVDLLAVAPAHGDEGLEFYLVLGSPSGVTRADDVGQIPTPTVPADQRGAILPLYRIVVREGTRGISSVQRLANRIGAGQ